MKLVYTRGEAVDTIMGSLIQPSKDDAEALRVILGAAVKYIDKLESEVKKQRKLITTLTNTGKLK